MCESIANVRRAEVIWHFNEELDWSGIPIWATTYDFLKKEPFLKTKLSAMQRETPKVIDYAA